MILHANMSDAFGLTRERASPRGVEVGSVDVAGWCP